MLRVLLNAIGLGRLVGGRPTPPVEAPMSTDAEPAPAPAAAEVAKVDLKTASPTYERDRKRAWRAKKRERKRAAATGACPDVSRDRSGTGPGHVPDAPQEKEEGKKERGARIPEHWRPDHEGLRLGAEVFGSNLENEIRQHRDYWLGRAGPQALRTDWQAVWRWRVRERAKQLAERQLSLALGPLGPVKNSGDQNADAQSGRKAAPRNSAQVARRRAEEMLG